MFSNEASNCIQSGGCRVQVTDEGLNRDIHLSQRTRSTSGDGERRANKKKKGML